MLINRKPTTIVISVIVAVWLAGCTSYQSLPIVIRSFIIPCAATYYNNVSWSPDGEHVAFYAARSGFAHQLYVMNPDGREVRALTSQPSIKNGLEWSPDGKQIAYTTDSGASVYLVTLDGQETLLSLPDPSLFSVTWSPDGERLLYGTTPTSQSGNADIYTIRINGSGSTRLTDSPRVEFSPLWSPDGASIAFIQRQGQATTIMIMDADGSGVRSLTDGLQLLGWSPDSQQIAYVKQGPNTFEVHTIGADGSNDTLITTSFYGASWLPDSRHVSLVGAPPTSTLFIYNLDDPTRIESLLSGQSLVDTAGPPTWSPDGSRVMFVAFDYSTPGVAVEEIFVMNRDFTGITRLTDNPGKQMCFNWPF